MKKVIIGSLGIALALLFSGCANKVYTYSPKTTNIMELKNMDTVSKISTGTFTDSDRQEAKVMCRLATPIGTPNGETFASYIKDALDQELMLADKFDQKSSNVLTANLDDIYGSTTIGNAYWEFKVTVKSSNGISYKVISRYDYESSFSAMSACSEMQRSFVPAVQKLNTDIISNPKFASLFSNSNQYSSK